MPRVCIAKIVLSSRVEIAAEIANLSENSVFVRTREPLRFGDRVTLTLFDIPVKASVAFVSAEEPTGAVLVFAAPPVLCDLIAVNVSDIAVLSPAAETGHEPAWTETTQPNLIPAEPTDPHGDPLEHLDILPPDGHDVIDSDTLSTAKSVDSLVMVEVAEGIATPAPVIPQAVTEPNAGAELAARALAAASMSPKPRSSSVPRAAPPAGLPAAKAPASQQSNLAALDAMLDAIQAEMPPPAHAPALGAAPVRAPAPELAMAAPAPPMASAPIKRNASGVGLPPPASRAASAAPAPAPSSKTPAALEAAPILTPAAVVPDLPQLESDGVTLRFSSADQYKAQHKANIAHGGIIVRSVPLPIGTQKFLGLVIPGRDRYTVSARVTFIGEGTVGFVIDSFPIHKAQLRSFAEV